MNSLSNLEAKPNFLDRMKTIFLQTNIKSGANEVRGSKRKVET